MAEVETRGMNMPDLPVVIIPHPLMTRTRDELSRLATEVLGQVIDALVEPPPGKP
jgi:hypothetical protein